MHQRNPRQEEDTTTDPEKQQIESDNENNNNNRKDFEPLPPDSAGFKDRIVSIFKADDGRKKEYLLSFRKRSRAKYSQFHLQQ
jgi:hypothetical protein